jgi:signal transduction histidine kinase
MLKAIGDAVIATDRDGRIEWLNLSAERLLGWSEQEAQGRRFAEVFHIVEQQRRKTGPNPEEESAQCGGEKADRISPMGTRDTCQKAMSLCALERTLQKGEIIVDEMLEIETGDGQRKVILISTAPLKNAQGDIEGAVVVNRDITERQRLQAEINQAQKMESVGRLAGGVAHEHNNMLNVISGFTELALEKISDDDPLRSDLEEVLGAARRSAAITRKLLAFARRQPVSPQKLDLNETVFGMLNMLKRLIGEAIELKWKPEQALWPVHIDPVQLDQILANLCINARDAIDGVGRIVITTRNVTLDEASEGAGLVPEGVCGDYVLLSVSDDGCGMDEKTRAHLFEPFFTTKDVDVGTGLGLSTVYGIVQQNKGFVTVESAPDAGAIFRIYLPRHTVAQGAGGAAQTAAQNAAVNRSHGETIMLVEDEASVSRLAARILEALGYAVLVAHTPREAIALASAHSGPLHLLLTDVVMPQMNGHVLAARLKQEYSGLKVLFMSGYTADVMAFQPTPDTEIDFIQKPFTLRELGNKVRAVLDR